MKKTALALFAVFLVAEQAFADFSWFIPEGNGATDQNGNFVLSNPSPADDLMTAEDENLSYQDGALAQLVRLALGVTSLSTPNVAFGVHGIDPSEGVIVAVAHFSQRPAVNFEGTFGQAGAISALAGQRFITRIWNSPTSNFDRADPENTFIPFNQPGPVFYGDSSIFTHNPNILDPSSLFYRVEQVQTTIAFATVPEPGTLALLGVGLALVATFRRSIFA